MREEEEIIRIFRGLPRGYNKKPKLRAKPIDQLMERITRRYKIESPRIEIIIIQNWREIVGAQKAHRCKPSKIVKPKTLIITTTNTTLRMELQFDRKQIIKNLQRFCGKDIIQNIIVR